MTAPPPTTPADPPPHLDGAPLVAEAPRGGPMAVTPHHAATSAALHIIARGGSAVDGAIAANAVLAVVAPDTCGLGGDLFALVHRDGDPSPATLNASGRAGSGADPERLRAAGLTEIPIHSPHAITVPGCVDGWFALRDRFGQVSMDEVLAPAIELAEEGFEASPELADALLRVEGIVAGQPSSPPLYPDGSPPLPGQRLRRPGLAATLRAIADKGRDAFYAGAPGEAIVTATNGIITPEDLARPQADWVSPLSLDVFGLTGWTIPPNSQGYLTLTAAWLFSQLDAPADPLDPDTLHWSIEAYRAAAWERDDLVADPDHLPMPPAALVDPDRLRPRVARLSRDTTATWPDATSPPGGTAAWCVTDGSLAVSYIQSNYHGIGSGISAGDTGVFLHDRGSGFNLIPGHPNELGPGKRPLHTLSPSLWTRDARTAMLLQTRGGVYQPQLLLQFLVGHLHAGGALEATQMLPRWTMSEIGPGSPSQPVFEDRIPETTLSDLRRRGHDVSTTTAWRAGYGPVSVIEFDEALTRGAADPRVSTTSALAG